MQSEATEYVTIGILCMVLLYGTTVTISYILDRYMLRLVTMVKCSYCQKELNRKVYCCTAHRVADFRRSKSPDAPKKVSDIPVYKVTPEMVDATELERKRLLKEYPELAAYKKYTA